MNYTVLPAERYLTFNPPDPAAMLAALPGSVPLYDGIIAAPHTVDTCIRLASMGERPPTPIEHYYRFPRDIVEVEKPFSHQVTTSAFMVSNPRSYILNSIGTGKTLACLWAADYLLEIKAATRVVIVSTVSALERAWGDALYIHFKHRSFAVLTGDAARRRKRLAEPKDFYIINYEGAIVLKKELLARDDIDVLILDEVAEISNQQTNKWDALNDMINPHASSGRRPKPWVWGATGSPTPNSPADAYGQCKLITPASVPKFFLQFKRLVMEHQSQHVWTPRDEANTIVKQAMRPAIRFTREQCLDLPPEIYQDRDVTLSADQQKHYKEIMKELTTEVAGGKISAVNEGVKLSKLLQIACGCVYDTTGVAREIDAGSRIEVLKELIEQVGEKVIIYVPFTAVTDMLYRELSKYWDFAVVTGETSQSERNRIFADFQNPNVRVDLIAHPQCMAHALTLTEASTIIWYAPVDSNRIYEQANGRITRPGQKHTANIINMCGSTVERRTYTRLRRRQSMQGMLLDMIAAGEQNNV